RLRRGKARPRVGGHGAAAAVTVEIVQREEQRLALGFRGSDQTVFVEVRRLDLGERVGAELLARGLGALGQLVRRAVDEGAREVGLFDTGHAPNSTEISPRGYGKLAIKPVRVFGHTISRISGRSASEPPTPPHSYLSPEGPRR